jgi:hypothetical protein
MGSLSALFAAFKALSWFSKFSGLLSFIPVVGPFLGGALGFVGGLLQLAWKLLARVMKGITKIVADMETAIAAVALSIFFLWLGLHWGIKFDAHLVKQARAELASLESQIGTERDIDDRKANAAIAAREKAKALPAFVPVIAVAPGPEVVTSVPPAAVAPPKQRVRAVRPATDKNGGGADYQWLFRF